MSERQMSPQTFTADYLGSPGGRTFYLQAVETDGVHSFLIEKQQVSVLADKLREMLMMIDKADTVGAAPPGRDPALALAQPVEPELRVGTIGLAYEEEGDRVIVLVRGADEDEEEEEPEETLDDEDSFSVRFDLRRDQVRAFVLHAVAIVEEGRPTCQLCGLPMDPEGHNCPASNGHRLSS